MNNDTKVEVSELVDHIDEFFVLERRFMCMFSGVSVQKFEYSIRKLHIRYPITDISMVHVIN